MTTTTYPNPVRSEVMDAKHRNRLDHGVLAIGAAVGLVVIGLIVWSFWQYVLGLALIACTAYAIGYIVERAIAAWNRRTPDGGK